ncbi:MAG TPA: hypothetical protein VMT46_04060 [Anaerolineaceae bacterium]|nr:hypothetical protein [Anaerolineaceae bacterium]
MIRVSVVLYSILREKLPPEARGRATLELPVGSRVADLFRHLDLPETSPWALNGALERDKERVLQDGDQFQAFRQGAGG